MTRPISPDEIDIQKTFPVWVWEVFNSLIHAKWSGQEARILFKEARMALGDRARKEGADLKPFHMDVESAYRAVGWKVVIDNPDYTESHEGSYTFSKAKKG